MNDKFPMDDLNYRISSSADIDDLMEVERGCFAGEAWPQDYLEAILRDEMDEGICVVGCYLGTVITGYGACHVSEATVMIDSVGVLPRFRGRGLGTDFLLLFDEFGRLSGCEKMELQVRVDNAEAIALYEHLGLNIESVMRGYYDEDGMDAFLMRGDLPIRYPADTLREERLRMVARHLLDYRI